MRNLKQNLLNILTSLSSLASIIGLIILGFKETTNAIIALCFMCGGLLILLGCLIWGIFTFIRRNNENDHLKVSVFTKFETLDQTHSIFETYRVIQSKRLVLTKIEQNFKWSGTNLPKISSKLQDVHDVVINNHDYDKAILFFRRPLLYNETGVVHFKAETDDFDNKAKPYLDYRVDTFVNIIHYRVILKNKDDVFDKPAKVLRKAINSRTSNDYEEIGSITFDQKAKCYEYYLTNPEPGYFYRIQWEK